MKRAKIFKVAAAIVLSLAAIFWFIKGFNDIRGGIRGGTLNLILSIFMLVLIILSWKRPLWGGIFTAVAAVVLAVYLNLILSSIYLAIMYMLLICAPMVVSGLFFIEADWSTRKRE